MLSTLLFFSPPCTVFCIVVVMHSNIFSSLFLLFVLALWSLSTQIFIFFPWLCQWIFSLAICLLKYLYLEQFIFVLYLCYFLYEVYVGYSTKKTNAQAVCPFRQITKSLVIDAFTGLFVKTQIAALWNMGPNWPLVFFLCETLINCSLYSTLQQFS